MDWIQIVIADAKHGLGATFGRSDVLKCMADLTSGYDALPEVHALDEPMDLGPSPAKKAKSGLSFRSVSSGSVGEVSASSGGLEPAEAKGIRIGERKMMAITKFLSHGTDEQLAMMQRRLQDSTYKVGALTDSLLSDSLIHPGLEAKDSGSFEKRLMEMVPPPGSVAEPLEHSKALTKEQGLFLLQKILAMFERKTARLGGEKLSRSRG